jgi:DNA-binding MarR family transcriptional regulator
MGETPSAQAAEDSENFALDQSLTHLLHRASQCATEAFQAEIGDAGMTARQFAVLQAVARHEGASQTDLVAVTGVDRSTLADIVRRMLERGWLQRRRSREDARAYNTRVTDAGHALLSKAYPAALRTDERLLTGLDDTQRALLVQTLSLLVDKAAATKT